MTVKIASKRMDRSKVFKGTVYSEELLVAF